MVFYHKADKAPFYKEPILHSQCTVRMLCPRYNNMLPFCTSPFCTVLSAFSLNCFWRDRVCFHIVKAFDRPIYVQRCAVNVFIELPSHR